MVTFVDEFNVTASEVTWAAGIEQFFYYITGMYRAEALVQWLKLAFKFQRNNMFLPAHLSKCNIVGSLYDRDVAC